MKKLLYFTLGCLLFSFAQAQEFAPLGAEWFYKYNSPVPPESSGPEASAAYAIFRAVRDTTVRDRACRVVEQVEYYYGGRQQWLSQEVVYADGDSVFLDRDGSFHLVFDFSAQVNDTIKAFTTPFLGLFLLADTFDRFVYHVDSTGVMVIAGDSLALQYVSDESPVLETAARPTYWSFRDLPQRSNNEPGVIIRGIGHGGRVTPFGVADYLSYPFDVQPEPLTCYTDANRSYRFLGIDCDSLRRIVASAETASHPQLRAFPNPFATQLEVALLAGGGAQRLEVRDLYGRTVHRVDVAPAASSVALNLAHLPAGLYWVQVAGRRSVKPLRIVKF